MRGHHNPVVIHLVKERNALLEFYQDARIRCAFRALAEIGLAVAMGMLGVLALQDHERGCNDLTLSRKTGYDAQGCTVYACDCGADEHNSKVRTITGQP